MTMVRWDMLKKLKEQYGDTVSIGITYGAATKETRKALGVKKSHSNDAYCIGEFHPKHRADFRQFQKQRRNNRILSKFYDAKYIDIRDESAKTGSQLSCGRTNRSEARNSEKNERVYRGKKIRKGRYNIRRSHYTYRPGDTIWTEKYGKGTVKGANNLGRTIILTSGKSVQISSILKAIHCGGWKEVKRETKSA